jgi:hypothetical protein
MLNIAKNLGNRMKRTKGLSDSEIKEPKEFENYIQRVERKAYELYEQRGCQDGNDLDDWFHAEQIIEQEMIKGK